jgi:predicted O-methyltransferase YrrM
MDPTLREFLGELYEFGQRNDQAKTGRSERMLNITPETGEFLRMLIISGNHRRVLELGTSNGYSTLWLADACRQVGGKVVTFEVNPVKHAVATANVRRAGLEPWVDPRLADIGPALSGLRDFDLVFLDTERSHYAAWWPDLRLAVRVGGLLVVDNVTSHASEMAPLIGCIAQTSGYSEVTVPIGNGELLVLREP